MARTLQQVIEAHLGAVTFQTIQLCHQLEQKELEVRELKRALTAAQTMAVAESTTETPDGQ